MLKALLAGRSAPCDVQDAQMPRAQGCAGAATPKRVTFDRSPPWLRPFGRAKARPISLPAKLCLSEKVTTNSSGTNLNKRSLPAGRGPGMGRVKPSCPGRLSPHTPRLPSPLVGLRRCAYGLSLARMRTREIHLAILRTPLRPCPGFGSPTGLNSNNAKPRRLYRAPYGAPEHRKPLPASPTGRGEGPRASVARTGMSCRTTARQRREAQGGVAPSGANGFGHFGRNQSASPSGARTRFK